MNYLPILLALALAGCANTGFPDRFDEDDEQCDAADYRDLVGSNVAAVTLPSGRDIRVFGENDIVTQDYRPERTNIVYDTGGKIRRVYCG